MVTLVAETVVAARAITAAERKVEAMARRVRGGKSDKGRQRATEEREREGEPFAVG